MEYFSTWSYKDCISNHFSQICYMEYLLYCPLMILMYFSTSCISLTEHYTFFRLEYSLF
jgi:hypothetical protein